MSMMRLARACLTGAVLSLAVSPGAAHPPDLPVDTKDNCVPFPEVDYGELNTRQPRESLDASGPMLQEILGRLYESLTLGLSGIPGVDLDLEFLLAGDQGAPLDQPLLDGEIIRTNFASSTAAKINPTRRVHARKMYLIGERCRRKGDYEMAENCYRETKLLCPGCDYAIKAQRRIAQVQALQAVESEDIGEESEPAKEPMPQYDYEIQLELPGVRRISSTEYEDELSDRIKAAQQMREEGRRIGEPQEPAKKEKEPTKEQLEDEYYEVPPPNLDVKALGKIEPNWHLEIIWTGDAKLLFETDWIKLAEAKGMYRVGERCRRGGDLDMAYRCYEDAHRACPQSRHGKKALQRMQQIRKRRELKEQEAAEAQAAALTDREGNARAELVAYFHGGLALEERKSLPPAASPITPQEIRAFESLTKRTPPPALIEIVEEESQPMPGDDEEESDCPLALCPRFSPSPSPQTETAIFYIATPERDLILVEGPDETAQIPKVPARDDLSDWLPQAISLLRGTGSLRIDAARFGRLMSQGESAIRALGCDVVHECGRSYVIYPGRPQ